MSSSDLIRQSLLNRIYDINEKDFDSVAIDVWRYQYQSNETYHRYCNLLGFKSLNEITFSGIPYLPIHMFCNHEIKTGEWQEETVFRSSGTTGAIQSRHFIRDIDWYHRITTKCFKNYFDDPADYTWIALLPSYAERSDSSLIDMVNFFMSHEKKKESKFFSHTKAEIISVLKKFAVENRKTILIGVSFALLELFEKNIVPVWSNLIVIETGGMKGRGPEITREELHGRMMNQHPGLKIASEYGMTELLSQAYLVNEHFLPGPTMKVFARDISDPIQQQLPGIRGALNIIDLGNIDTCCFIATDDVGIVHPDGSFDVLGRMDQSDVRGCNLLYA